MPGLLNTIRLKILFRFCPHGVSERCPSTLSSGNLKIFINVLFTWLITERRTCSDLSYTPRLTHCYTHCVICCVLWLVVVVAQLIRLNQRCQEIKRLHSDASLFFSPTRRPSRADGPHFRVSDKANIVTVCERKHSNSRPAH